MITTILLGIVTSLAADLVSWMNKKLEGTVLRGNAAFVISLIAAFVGGSVKVFWFDGQPLPSFADLSSWSAVSAAFAQVWVVSQVYFTIVMKTLGVRVQK